MDLFRSGGPRGRGRGRVMGLGVGRAASNNSGAPGKPATNPLDLVRGEMAVLKKLNHPHIVRLFEVLDDPSGDSLYMGEVYNIGSIIYGNRVTNALI